jgi:regulation of enolase protein 1 (concanavalin A-like superfamily)
MKTSEKYFSFITKTNFASKTRFDQSGVVMYLDSDNWFKASVEYENEKIQRLGSVVTQNGYSDWCSTDISAEIKSIWFRFSRRESDYYIEYSMDGKDWKQMRIFHMFKGNEEISFGIYACSPGKEASFDAEFTNMELTECKWEKEG